MKKISKILKIIKEMPRGYQPFAIPGERDAFEAMCELIPDRKYIKYFITQEWIEDKSLPVYVPKGDSSLKIPQGDLRFVLDIYYE